MAFSQSELQQLSALLTKEINDLEQDRRSNKETIKYLVDRKRHFKEQGEKTIVDGLNCYIRGEYKDVDSKTAKINKLITLKKAIKREIHADPNPGRKDNEIDTSIIVEPVHDYAEERYDEKILLSNLSVGRYVFSLKQFQEFVDTVAWRYVYTVSYNFDADTFDVEILGVNKYGEYIIDGQPQVEKEEKSNPENVLSDYTKPSNPKDAIGSGKLPMHLWPTTATAMGCIGFLNGMLKYGRSNFRAVGIRASIYYDAAIRHLNAWFEGEECDPDDGVPHLAAALACIAIIVDASAADKLTDDRAIYGGYRKLVDELTPHVARLKKLHESKNPHHYTIADNAERV